MADLSHHERAQIMADELGIDPGSFAGRDEDAIIAMAMLKRIVERWPARFSGLRVTGCYTPYT